MATKKLLYDLDLQKNKILNVVVQPLSSAPSTPTEGQIYFDTVLHQFGVYQNTAWAYLAVGGTDTEAVQDIVAAMLSGSTVVTATYNDPAGTLALTIGTGQITDTMVSGSAAINADKIADGTTNKVFTATMSTKLAGVATGATANSSDATLLNRANHTGTQSADTLTDGTTNKAFLATERTKLTGIATGATANSTDAVLEARANHTGTQLAATISDFDTQVRTSRLDQLAAPTAAVSFNGQRNTNVADPTSPQDSATKAYVDAAAMGLDFKPSVRAASTANVTVASALVNGLVMDGVTLATGNRVLLKNQTTASENGIYTVVASGAAPRATDADTSAEVTSGMITFVEEGTVNGGQQWILTTTGTITLGTTSLTFTQFSGASTTTAGAGLTASGNVFAVGAGTGISVAADTVGIDTSLVVQKKTFSIGDGSTTSFPLTHSLGTQNIQVTARDNSTNELFDVAAVATSTSVVTVSFNTAPTTNQYTIIVQG